MTSLARNAAAAACLLFVLIMIAALPARAQADLPYGGQLVYTVYRGDSQIGEHRYRFERQGDQLHVHIDVSLQVKIGPITVFRYTHQNHETWENGELVALESKTNDDGKPFEVRARRVGDVLEVQGMNGTIRMPRNIMPSSYWHPDNPKRTQFLDTQRGILLALTFAPAGEETVGGTEGEAIFARKYDVTGDLNVTAWYAETGAWAKLAFPARGSMIDYVMTVGRPIVP